MRGQLSFARSVLAAAALLLPLFFTGHADAADTRRVIVTQGADYSGFDSKTVKNTDLPGCQTACLADSTCKAFTFNTKAGWCFLKSDFGPLASTPGAVAGRVVSVADMAHYNEFARRVFANEPNIRMFRSSFCLSRVKYDTKIPVD